MNRPLLSILSLVFFAYTATSQTATEAFRLSASAPTGTARNLGVGNSMFTIGPDFSAISTNPAGIGGYWKSEFVGTFHFASLTTNSLLQGDTSHRLNEVDYNKLRLANLGFIVAMQPPMSKWSTSNWAIGINRTAEFDREIHFNGYSRGSITQSWRENATGLSPNELNGFEEGLAYSSGAIYDLEEDNLYEIDYTLNAQFPIYKEESTVISGGKSELFLGYGANLAQKFILGFSVNLPLVNSDVSRVYRENDPQDGIPFFNNLKYTSSINTSGYGVNGKFGVIVKPNKYVNISLAAHTPTKFHLTDNFNTTLTYDYTDENHAGPILSESPYGSFQYALRTPWRLVGGVGLIAGKSGFVSAGVQWSDYSTMRYDYNTRGNGNLYKQQELEVNSSIQQRYGPALQFNMGGELAVRYIRVRGGFSMVQSAFINDDSFDPTYHFGLGYRGDNYFIDLAYSYAQQDDGYIPYETQQAPEPLVVLDNTAHRIAATVGFKF